MRMPIYDRPTKVLMQDFARERLKPGQQFGKREAIAWFREHYPKIKSNTVGMHVEGMAINNPSFRKHHSNIRPGTGFDLFYKLGPGEFRLWDQHADGPPSYGHEVVKAEVLNDVDPGEEEHEVGDDVAASEFAFEKDLRNYLSRNLHVLEEGLRLYEDEDREFNGIEFPVGGRFIDILALDRDGNFVVIELKVSRGYDRVVGQLLRYMAWISSKLAAGKKVRGMIVASEITEDLKLATSLIEGVKLWQYRLSFQVDPVAINASSA
jgi:endonuclease